MVTIGVYGFTAAAFLGQLAGWGVGLLLDLRQRRGVRGPDHSWADSARLQRALSEAGVDYRHVKELAPTTALRELQYREDDRRGVGKRNRIALAPEYVERYTREILDPFDLGALVAELPSETRNTRPPKRFSARTSRGERLRQQLVQRGGAGRPAVHRGQHLHVPPGVEAEPGRDPAHHQRPRRAGRPPRGRRC